MSRKEIFQLPIYERKYYLQKFIEQREKENKAIEAAKSKMKTKK